MALVFEMQGKLFDLAIIIGVYKGLGLGFRV